MPTDPRTVSVVLCTFDGARFVEQQLESILTQSHPIDELVVSDDGSRDDTVERVRAVHGRVAPGVPLVLLRNESPLGVVANFEQGIRAASGELIALADQDDVWHPDRIARAVDAFAADSRLLVVHSDAMLVDADGRPLGTTLLDALEVPEVDRAALRDGDAFPVLLRRNLATGTTMTVDSRLVPLAVPFPADWVHDEWLAALGAASGRLRLIEATLVDYRQHGGNQIGAHRPGLRQKLSRVFESRAERNGRLLRRAEQLVERLQGAPVAPETRAEASAKLDFERMRDALPASRVRRIGMVRRARRDGSYARYSSRGEADVIRDLLQAP